MVPGVDQIEREDDLCAEVMCLGKGGIILNEHSLPMYVSVGVIRKWLSKNQNRWKCIFINHLWKQKVILTSPSAERYSTPKKTPNTTTNEYVYKTESVSDVKLKLLPLLGNTGKECMEILNSPQNNQARDKNHDGNKVTGLEVGFWSKKM